MTSFTNKTKLDQFFTNPQYQIHGYKMFRRNKGKYSWGILFYVNENISSKVLHLNSIPGHNEVILLEFSIKLKWFCTGVYKAPSQKYKYFIDNLSKSIELNCQYYKTKLIGGLSLTTENKNLEIYECFQPGIYLFYLFILYLKLTKNFEFWITFSVCF